MPESEKSERMRSWGKQTEFHRKYGSQLFGWFKNRSRTVGSRNKVLVAEKTSDIILSDLRIKEEKNPGGPIFVVLVGPSIRD